MVQVYPKMAEYNRAVLAALLNYTSGIARGMVEYGVENGVDARRRFYYHYMPLADDLQQLLIQELYSLTPVNENGIDGLFNQVERITELYTRHGNAEDHMSEKWIKAAVMRNLPKHITKDLAIQPKDAKTTGEVRHIVNIYIYIYIYIYVYMHDYQTGMPRGQSGPMLCMAANESTEEATDKDSKSREKNKEQERDSGADKIEDLNAATKGKGKGKKNSKGYGECWNCGEWGGIRAENARILTTLERARGHWERSKVPKEKARKERVEKAEAKMVGAKEMDTNIGPRAKELERASTRWMQNGTMLGAQNIQVTTTTTTTTTTTGMKASKGAALVTWL